LALTADLVVSLRRSTRRNGESAKVGVVRKSAESRVSRACARNSAPDSAAEASGDDGALTSAVSVVVSLGRVASWHGEGTSVGVVSQAAESGVCRARASDGVENSAAQASGDDGALANAVSVIVSLRSNARGENECASGGIVRKSAESGVGGARTGDSVPGSSA